MDRNESKAFIKKQSPKSFLEMDGGRFFVHNKKIKKHT